MIGRREASNSCTDDDHLEPSFFWHRRHLSSKPTKKFTLCLKKNRLQIENVIFKHSLRSKISVRSKKFEAASIVGKKLIAAKNIFFASNENPGKGRGCFRSQASPQQQLETENGIRHLPISLRKKMFTRKNQNTAKRKSRKQGFWHFDWTLNGQQQQQPITLIQILQLWLYSASHQQLMRKHKRKLCVVWACLVVDKVIFDRFVNTPHFEQKKTLHGHSPI